MSVKTEVGRAAPRLPSIAEYYAWVSVEVESSAVRLGDVEKPVMLRGLESAPEYWPAKERYPGLQLGSEPDKLETLALLKFAAAFHFDARIGGATGDELREAVYAAFPGAGEARAEATEGREPGYARVAVSARVRADGECEWGYSIPSQGIVPSGAAADFGRMQDGKTGFDLYAQNLIRADVYDMLAARGVRLTWKS
jgi:hypothetical protein